MQQLVAQPLHPCSWWCNIWLIPANDLRLLATMKFVASLLGAAAAVNPLSPGNENLPDRFGHEIVKAYPVINVQYEFPAVSKDSAARLHAAEFASSSLAQVMKIAARTKNINKVLAGNPTFLSAFPGAAGDDDASSGAGGSLSSIVDKASELNRGSEDAAASAAVDEEIQSKQGGIAASLKRAAETFGSISSFLSLSGSANDASELLIGLGEVAGPPTQAFGKSYIDPTKGHSWASCNMNFSGCPMQFQMEGGKCMPSAMYQGPCDGQNFSEFTGEMMQLWADRCQAPWACAEH